MFSKELIQILFLMLIEVLGWSLVPTFLPYLAGSYGATPFEVGLIFAFYSIGLLFSSPITGSLSDKLGRKKVLLLCQFFTLISFLMLGLSNSLLMIFLSRILNGLFSSITVIMAYLSDISSEKKELYFNYSETIKSAAYVIGPLAGGLLATINYSVPPLIAAGASFIGIIFTYLTLKETLVVKERLRVRLKDFIPTNDYIDCFNKKPLRKLLVEFLIINLGYTIITSSIGLYVQYQLGFGPLTVGVSLTIVASLGIVFQLIAIPWLIKNFKEKKIKFVGLALITSSTLAMYFINSIVLFYIVMLVFGLGLVLTKPMITSEISKKATKKKQGSVMGVVNSLGSIGAIIAPIIGGLAISIKPELIGLIASIITFIGLSYGMINRA